jgi:hypothetical protein
MSPVGPKRRPMMFARMSGFGAEAEMLQTGTNWPLLTDAVEKRFCGPIPARLIQDQLGVRNIDSRDRAARFDCCAFLFYSFSAVTFSTASTHCGSRAANLAVMHNTSSSDVLR